MFDINTVNKRYFEIKIGKSTLEVEPPTKKMLNKIISLSGAKDIEITDGMYEAVGMILNKNKTSKKISDEIVEALNFDEINGILIEYFEWLSKTKNSPN